MNFREKKFVSLNVKIDKIDQYKHGYRLVISGDIIPHGTPTENCEDIVLKLSWKHLNMNIGEDELSISHCMGKNLLIVVIIGKYF